MQFAANSGLAPAAEIAPRRRLGALLEAAPKDVLAAVAVFVVAVIVKTPDLAQGFDHAYWREWPDQWNYFVSARAFAAGKLSADLHWYPLLYPLALAAFIRLPQLLAATIVNAACYGLTYLGFRAVAARFGLSPIIALPLFVATTLLGSDLASAWVVPWTTTMSAALIWLALARVADFCEAADPAIRPRSFVLTGVLLGLIPLCRPADAILSAILGLFLLLCSFRRPGAMAGIACLIAGGAAGVGPYVALHLAIYGPRTTDYAKLAAAFGFDFGHLGWKAQTLLVDAGAFFPFGRSLIEQFPWLLIGAAGILVAMVRSDRRRLSLLIGLPALAYAILMLCFVDLTPTSLWLLQLFHYFKWLMPMMGLFAYDFVRGFLRRRTASIAALALVVAATSLHYEAVAAGGGEPARLLVFPTPRANSVQQVFEALSVVSDAQGRLRNLFEYRQVPDGRGLVYAAALRRDFAGDERWTDAPADVIWPVLEPPYRHETALIGGDGETPLARYRAVIKPGLPCWLGPFACNHGLVSERDPALAARASGAAAPALRGSQ